MNWKAIPWPGGMRGLAAAVGGRLGLAIDPETEERRLGRGRKSTQASKRSREAGHEREDISARVVAYVLATIVVSYLILTGGLFLMIGHLSRNAHHRYAHFTPQQTRTITTKSPHLDVNPLDVYADYRKHELQRLDHYDRLGGGYARIPIQRAMALELGQGLDHPALSSSGSAAGGSGT